jgi:acyl-CoA thioester hydrolase
VVRPRLLPEEFRCRAPIEVRFRDVDMMGHVNNAVYLTYFEVARAHYWRALGETESRRIRTYVVARAECDFLSPATLDDDLECLLRVVSFGRTSFVFEYLLRDRRSGRPVAEGRTVQVMYDYAAGRPRPLDEPFKEAIRRLEGRAIEEQ